MRTWPGLRAQEHGVAAAQIQPSCMTCAALAEVTECITGMSCLFLTQPSTGKPTWGCRRYC